jgi:hypothetical protein
MILINGCSFTEGYNLPPSTNWPTVLASQLQKPFVNLAIGGSGNHRIFRTTIEYLNTHQRPELVVIGWTALARYELISNQGSYLRVTNTGCLPDTAQIPHNFDHVHKFYVTELHNDYLLFRDYVHSVLHLQNFFKQQNIKFLFFSALENYIQEFKLQTALALQLADQSWQWRDRSKYEPCEEIHQEYQELKQLVDQIDLDHWVLHNSYSMQQYLSENNYQTDHTLHFLQDGHQCWANVIAKELT